MEAESEGDKDHVALLSQEESHQTTPQISRNGSTQPFTTNRTVTSSKPRPFLNGKIKPATSAPDVSHESDGGLQEGMRFGPNDPPSLLDRGKLTIYTKLRFMGAKTSFDGLKFIHGGPRTIFWIIILILSITAMSFVLWFITDVYLAMNTTFSKTKHFPTRLNFPAVTICNHNPYYDIIVYSDNFYSLPNETQVAIAYEYYRRDRLIDVNTSMLLEIINNSFSFNIFTEQFNQSVSLETVLREHGHKLEYSLIRCTFDGKSCGVDDFIEIVTAYGLCYAFNLDGSWNVTSAGTSHGLSLVVDINQLNYMYETSHTAGLQVFVHPQDEYPYSGEFFGFSVPPGFETQVAISLTNTKLMEPPYGQCGNRAIHDPYIFPCTTTQSSNSVISNSSNTTADDVMQSRCPQPIIRYTRQRCLDECEALYQYRRCGCKADYLPAADIRVCNLNELFNCLLEVTDQFAVMKNTMCDCPVECDRVQYNTKLSRSYFPAHQYPLVSGISHGYIRANYLSLLLYFDQLEYTEVREEVDFDTFRYLADFGSHLGLFTGAGVLSFFEIFELCLY